MFENTLGRKKREELGDQILMKQLHVFKSAECYSSILGVIAVSKDSLPAVQSCSWKPPGATKPKALAKPPCCSFLPPRYLSCLAGVAPRALCPPAVLLAKEGLS